jgi:hypothetical protein
VKVEGLLLQRVHIVEESNNQGVIWKFFARSAKQDSSWRLKFASEILGGIVPLKCSKGGRYRNKLIEFKFRWKDANSFWSEILEEEWTNSEISSWKKWQNPVDHWISQICEKVKAKCLLVVRISRGVATIGWEATGVVDPPLEWNFGISTFQQFWWQGARALSVEKPKVTKHDVSLD